MIRKIRKHQKKRLLKLMCLSTALLTVNICLPEAAMADPIVSSTTYSSDTAVTDDVTITSGYIGANSGKEVSFTGDFTVTQNAGDGYALLATGYGWASGYRTTLTINSGVTNKTVKINGNVQSTGVADEDFNNSGRAKIDLTLNNEDSYLAGKLILDGTADKEYITLNLNNGATWYVPDNNYSLAPSSDDAGIYLNLSGGIVDLYHATPSSIRTAAPVGERTFSLTNSGSSANGATFVLSSDVVHDKADQVSLTGVTGNNTYYVQVAYDASEGKDGTYKTATNNGVTILTTNNAADSVEAKSYTTTQDVAAGLLTKTLTLTPEITTVNGVTKLTSVTVAGNGESSDGPAQDLAIVAASMAKGAMAAWRAENNDLLRRMGDLREADGKAGTWTRIYGGETDIFGSLPSTLNYKGLQIGYDRKIAKEKGNLFTGYAVSHMDGDLSYGRGSGDADSTMFGIYGSYLGEKGHFADLIVKYGHLKNNISTTSGNVLYEGAPSANGLNMSLEYGYHKKLKNNWYFEPQAELNYGHINSTDYRMQMNGAAGAQVNNAAVDSLIGRIGINIGKKTKTGNIYTKLSLAREFSGDVATTASYGSYSNYTCESMKDTWLEYGIGFNSQVNKSTNFYGEVSKTTGDKLVDKWKANIGFRHSF